MSLHRSSRHSLGSSSSRHSTISVGGTRYSASRGPSKVHAASLLSLQLWAISELRDVLPPLGERARAARLAFLGVVAALAAAMVLSYPLGAFASRLFSPSRPPSARRRLASAVLAVYLSLACLTLCLAEEGWTGLDAAYFSTATLTTVGVRNRKVNTPPYSLVASTLSIVGPLAAALFWRDSARARASRSAMPPHQEARYSGRQDGGTGFTRPLSHQDEEEHQARVADAIWAFVGFLMVLLGCAGVFLRASRGGSAVGEGGDLPTTTAFGAAFSALLALTTVG
ncbi:unnamed protein product [Ectocarpus fasciculatus]